MIWCMKSENKCKRKGIKVLPALGEKNLAKRMEENDKKNLLEPWPHRKERKKSWKTFEKVSLNTWKSVFIKILYTIFDRSKNKFDRSKMLQLIHHQLSTDRNRQRLTNIFNRNFDRSKFWKKQFFWKTKQNNAETP